MSTEKDVLLTPKTEESPDHRTTPDQRNSHDNTEKLKSKQDAEKDVKPEVDKSLFTHIIIKRPRPFKHPTFDTEESRRVITVKVKGQDGNELTFKMKRGFQLHQLMSAYCTRRSLDWTSIVFLFDGRRVNEYQTLEELGIQDGDEIDAMMRQYGGCCHI